jgi:alpha-1,6-mannosyltransferase
MPIVEMTGALVLAGLAFLALPTLIRSTVRHGDGTSSLPLLIMLLCGLAARLVLVASEPILEDDYQRYLWDGGVTARGLDPYAATPDDAREAGPGTPLGSLAQASAPLLERVKYRDLTTIYPPLAQGAFALAHLVSPFSLTAWRAVLLMLDLGVLGLLILLLKEVGRAPLWAALYWWNPLAIKEVANSAHMEPVVLVPVLAGLLLALRGHSLWASASIALASGAKLWPVLLLPLIWRPLWREPHRLASAAAIAGGIAVLLMLPMLRSGLDESAGLVAFATSWQTNSAHFPALKSVLAWLGLDRDGVDLPARAMLAAIIIGVSLAAGRAPVTDPRDLLARAVVVIGALLLLSPAQYPWYYLWLLPLLALAPVPGFLVLTATLPLYYLRFYLLQIGRYDLFLDGVVWLIWAPAWILLAWRLRQGLGPVVRLAGVR